MGQVARLQGDYTGAQALYNESLARWRGLGINQWGFIAECLDGLAAICAVQQQFDSAARLFGAAGALREMIEAPPPSLIRSEISQELATVRAQLDEATFATAWAEGHAFSSEQAIEHALALPAVPASASPPVAHESVAPVPPAHPANLTAREVEVLRLLVEGLTYAQIADRLVITRRTVNAHLTSIYSKLGVTSRTAAMRYALDHSLV